MSGLLFVVALVSSHAPCLQANADTPVKILDAKITGETYLGKANNAAMITLGKAKCSIAAVGNGREDGGAPDAFRIELVCGKKKQILWDIAKPAPDDFAFDDPLFALLWAGDKDGDGKIDLEMEMSPKYSCSKKVLFLSSKAAPDEIVGVSGNPTTTCGE